MENIKKEKFKALYLQIIFTLLAFALMVILSYAFNSRTVRENLSRNAESVLFFTQQQINTELIASQVMLESFAQAMLEMHRNERSQNTVQIYLNNLSEHVLEESELVVINGFYGYFEEFGFLYSDHIEWDADEDENFSPKDEMWYAAATENCGKVVETAPYIDFMTDKYIITYARCIHDDNNDRIAVVCIDVPIDQIGEIVTATALHDGGYGMLAAPDLTLIAHANDSFTGRRLDDPEMPISRYADRIARGEELNEQLMEN